MAKKMENMTRVELLEEFKGGQVVFRTTRRPTKMVPLTLRIHPDLMRKLSREAQRRGVGGHTTLARMIIESAIETPAAQRSFADVVADAVVGKLKRQRVANA